MLPPASIPFGRPTRARARHLTWRLATAAWLSLAGCIDDDDDAIAIELDDLSFAIDITGWAIDSERAGALLHTACTATSDVCGALGPNVCPGPSTCSSTCGVRGRCELQLDIRLRREVNVIAATPALATSTAATLSATTIDEVDYEVTGNTLDVDTPSLALSVATPALTDIRPVGELDAVPAATAIAPRGIRFVEEGRDVLAVKLAKYRVPFDLRLDSHLTVRDAPIPTGRLDLRLIVHATARR